jgi:hypothetical protein
MPARAGTSCGIAFATSRARASHHGASVDRAATYQPDPVKLQAYYADITQLVLLNPKFM